MSFSYRGLFLFSLLLLFCWTCYFAFSFSFKHTTMSKKIEVIGFIEPCPRCSTLMQRRAHKYLTEGQLRQEHYFTEWDVCSKCHYIQHYEIYKKLVSSYTKPTEIVLNDKLRLL